MPEVRAIPEDFRGARVGVLGLGKSGVALARVLGGLGADLLLSDTRPRDGLESAVKDLAGVTFELEAGGHTSRVFDGRDLLVISPGVDVHHPIVQQALAAGVPVAGEVEIAYRLSAHQFLAVTGTNGKSTTVTLLGHILGPRALVAGNIGKPLVSEVRGAPAGVEFVAAEISSFQLETVHAFSPRAAVLTNFTPDHLDRHPNLEEYFAAKARIFENLGPEQLAVISADDPGARRFSALLREGTLPEWLPGFPRPSRPPAPRLVEFSAQGPVARGTFYQDGAVHHTELGRLFDWNFPGLPGPHNIANALAATAVAVDLGVPPDQIAAGLALHEPLHYRMEKVGIVNGVVFVNDSKATNVASVVAALQTYEQPVVLIAGGKDKGFPFEELAEVITRHVAHLVLIGEAADRLAAAAGRAGHQSIHRCETLSEAVSTSYRLAQSGQTVLLSPACSSFDMFENAEDRGNQFNQLVARLGIDSEVTSA